VVESLESLHKAALAERRGSVRRTGDLVPVEVAAGTESPVRPGWVVDRSRTGLCLAVGEPAKANSVLQVRSKLYPDCTPWVPVSVRTCQPLEDCWLVGCEFMDPPPWSVLLTFG
jgi:hypothetical protein